MGKEKGELQGLRNASISEREIARILNKSNNVAKNFLLQKIVMGLGNHTRIRKLPVYKQGRS